MTLQVNTHMEQYTCVLELKGDLLCDSVSEVEKALEKAAEEFINHVVIDCQHLRYISTEGINVLLSYLSVFKARKIKLTLRNLNASVLRLFRLLKLDTRFHIDYDTTPTRGAGVS